MRYLVTQTDLPPFFTDVFQYENNFVPCVGMIVYNLMQSCAINQRIKEKYEPKI